MSPLPPARAAPQPRFGEDRPVLGRDAAGWSVYVAIFGTGGVLSWLSRTHPGMLPVWAPWDFSWAEFLATAIPLWWFLRGLAQTPVSQRPSAWRRFSFLLGVVLIYAVLQTHFDYMAQHMFFLNRVQHVIMHHIGPFLIGLGGAGATLRGGMPAPVRRLTDSRPVAVVMRVLQQPVIAVVLFVGLFYLWLIPVVHFRAMIDARLYAVMNWSMVLDGLLFWTVVLDKRPRPPARLSFGTRAGMAFATTFPAIIIGYYITSANYDLYPSYALCGRLFPSMGALTDQHIGGIVTWVPPTMMGVIATMIVIRTFLQHEAALTIAEEEAGRR